MHIQCKYIYIYIYCYWFCLVDCPDWCYSLALMVTAVPGASWQLIPSIGPRQVMTNFGKTYTQQVINRKYANNCVMIWTIGNISYMTFQRDDLSAHNDVYEDAHGFASACFAWLGVKTKVIPQHDEQNIGYMYAYIETYICAYGTQQYIERHGSGIYIYIYVYIYIYRC